MKSTHTRLLSVFLVFIILIGVFTSCALTEENSTLQYEFKAPSGSGKSSAKFVAQDTEPQITDSLDVSETVSAEITEETSEPITYLSPIKGLEALSPSLVKEINDAWTAKFGCEYKGDVLIDLDYINKYAWSDRYLGMIDGFVVVLRPAALAAETKKIIGGYEFVLGSAFNLMLYKNGIFYTIEEAYSNKIADIEFVKTVYLRNNEYLRYFNPEITIRDKFPLNDTELAKINDDWQKQIGNGEIFIESNDKFSNHNSVYYFGNFNSCYILMKKMSNAKGAVLIEISGRRIMIPKSYVFVTYKDGVFYSLQEAYEKNYLTDEDIFYIAEEISISQFKL